MIRPALALFLLAAPTAPLMRAEVPVIPRPVSVTEAETAFIIRDGATLTLPDLAVGADLIPARLTAASGLKFSRASGDKPADITFVLEKAAPGTSPEAYRMVITPEGVRITGDAAGLYYGAQTLAQMLEGSTAGATGIRLACATIADSPRFAWRGYMLDESRHFSGEAQVKRLLDTMSAYKLNRFHWHLTDSPGWRIEIKKYPKLTDIGGRGDESDLSPDAPAHFYTQAQIRDIVAYAKARHIVVVPEIDMPGHADAAVKAYPENDGGGFLHKGRTGKWPRFTFNPGREETLRFLDDILVEVAGLFPEAGVIHLGGDEVNFGWKKWPELPEVQALMKREGLKDNAAVEAWFNRRMAKTVNDLGLDSGGWDEIAGRGLPKDRTVVFWWRHDKPGVLRDALNTGSKVVLCPRRPLYFDFIQNAGHKSGRTWGGFNPIADVYDFPASLKLSPKDESQVLGMEACLWTENTRDAQRREFLTWPRLIAVAESAWTPAARKNYDSFAARLKPQLPLLRARGLTVYDPFANSPEVLDKKPAPTGAGPLDKPE